MRRHAEIGERIISAAPSLAHAAPLVRASHEHYDGGGYPDHLAGSEIPLGARIIAVCDAFDAMTSRRPYSDPIVVGEALAELGRCSGSQFDPAVVHAFYELADSEAPSDAPGATRVGPRATRECSPGTASESQAAGEMSPGTGATSVSGRGGGTAAPARASR